MNNNFGTRHLELPAWGPYSKRMAGISHIPHHESGIRFDLSVFPGFYRGRVDVPDARWASGWHPWEASPDLRYLAVRHELEWKDRVYADVSYSEVDGGTRLIRAECVNATDTPQSLCLHAFAGLTFPEVRAGHDESRDVVEVELPEKHVLRPALEYESLAFATPRPTDSLVYDALRRGEALGQGFLHGSGVGCGFGAEGDRLELELDVPDGYEDARLLLRARSAGPLAEPDARTASPATPQATPALRLEGLATEVVAVAGDRFHLVEAAVGPLRRGTHRLAIVGTGGGAVEIDSVIVVEAREISAVRFRRRHPSDRPEIRTADDGRSVELRYPELDRVDAGLRYAIGWDTDRAVVREFLTDHLDELLRRAAHDHVRSVITDRWRGEHDGAHYTNVFIRPVTLGPRETTVVWAWAGAGDAETLRSTMRRWAEASPEEREEAYSRSRALRVDRGDQAPTGQKLMAATALTNVVYPVMRCGTPIVHDTPGRWWNSLYTWDSGFVGLGLLELDRQRAIDCLRMYLTDPADEHRAFVHHGTPLPVQIYLLQEIWNRAPDDDLLAHVYPALRRMHAFLAGRSGSSTTDRFASHLLAPWDYFYNSGGWDDYPPQVHVHTEGLEGSVAPAANTAHAVRTAKILAEAARRLGLPDDCAEYERDIERFTEALQVHAYDAETGYFSYVRHDAGGIPTGPLRHASGENFNMGLDGAAPLIAGVCTEEQTRTLVGYLEDEGRLWTDIGLSTVDRSAPYYRIDGYWNGAVWFPHQWFYWKTCLDLARPLLAWKIASTALEVWNREAGESYNCYEHFIIETGRGAGWHQFSGLSTPILLWYGAYHEPGRLTFGFDAWLTSPVRRTGSGCSVDVRTSFGSSGSGATLTGLYCAEAETDCRVTYGGSAVPTRRVTPNVISFDLPRGAEETLSIVGTTR